MFKILFKVVLFTSIMFGLGTYASYLMTGRVPNLDFQKPALSLPEINILDLSNSISDVTKSFKKETPVKDTYLYKWRDTNGVIHYTSEKPSEDVNYELITLDNNTNIVPAVSKSKTQSEEPIQQKSPELSSTEFPTNVYSPKGIEDLIDQAKDVQNMVNDQFSQQENISNQE